jgi:alditol oxidase
VRNWAGNHEYRALRIHHPESVEQVQELVRTLPKVRALGSRHSFNDLADSPGELISLDGLERQVEVDAEASTVTIGGGVRYGELCGPLERAGFGLHNLASLPHISVAGACATATHGSGVRLGNLATAVRAMDVVTADGEIASFSRNKDPAELAGAPVALGGLGVVTELTLDLRPTYRMRQDVYEGLPFASVESRFDEMASSGDSVSFFTSWRAPVFEQVWIKRRVGEEPFQAEPHLFGARLATRQLHPIPGMPAEACTEQLGVPGPWHERLPHFRMDHTPSAGDELQSEYFVARHDAVAALTAVAGIAGRLAPLVQASEIRTIAADELWMSPSYGRDSVTIHFTWHPDWPAVRAAMPLVEAALAPFELRPHWGKLFTLPADEIQARYERRPDFVDLLRRHDPNGKFRNGFLDRYVVAGADPT